MCKISIVVPIYNAEKTLNRCIDSILNQTFKDFELILVNDGSKDFSKKIIDEYAVMDNRIIPIHKENGGEASARNVGINLAKGFYLMFCDSDDYVCEDWCESLYRKIIQYPNSFISASFYKVNEKIEIIGSQNDLNQVDYYDVYINNLSPYSWNKIYNLSKIKSNNIYFDENVRISVDVLFNLKYLSYTDKNCYCISQPLYYYVFNETSIMNSYHYDSLREHLAPFSQRLPYIEQDKIEEYCDRWLFILINLFKNVLDSRNNMPILQKMKYNQRVINSKEFIYCINNASGKNESPFVIKLYKTRNYYLVYIVEKIIELKNRMRRKCI